jgi:colanic acid biosynthesis glycosyl transferase WcaI
MRVLIITQNFLPEMGALSNRMYPIARELQRAGHEVTVATGMPNYPEGKPFAGYRGRLAVRETVEGYQVIRTAFYTVPRNISKLRQMLSYLSFIPAVFISALRAGRCDAVLVTTPPIFPILPAIVVARLRRAKLILDVRDLWSDELINFAGLRDTSLAVRVFRWIEHFGYRSADMVTCTTQALIDTVVERGAERATTVLYPNGADLELFKPSDPEDLPPHIVEALGDRFVVMYCGLLGLKHDLDTFIEAAELLRNEKEVVFALAGNGAAKQALVGQCESRGLTNVIFLGELRLADIPKALSRADVCFAGERGGEYQEKLISVKLFEYMACERPIVSTVVGEGARVVDKSCAGFSIESGHASAVAASIMTLKSDPRRRRAMGKSGRAYVEANYSRGEWARRFERWVVELVEERSEEAKLEVAESRP